MPIDDVVEVSNYVAALEHGLERLREGFPLSNRLIREIHGILLFSGRESNKSPGEFRRSQNWIDGSRRAMQSLYRRRLQRWKTAWATLNAFSMLKTTACPG